MLYHLNHVPMRYFDMRSNMEFSSCGFCQRSESFGFGAFGISGSQICIQMRVQICPPLVLISRNLDYYTCGHCTRKQIPLSPILAGTGQNLQFSGTHSAKDRWQKFSTPYMISHSVAPGLGTHYLPELLKKLPALVHVAGSWA
jgi:hypothetical protein